MDQDDNPVADPWYLIELLDELHATANRVRAGLAQATNDYSYATIAKATGLSVGTIQRWSVEHPTATMLRAAETRRSMTVEQYDTDTNTYRSGK